MSEFILVKNQDGSGNLLIPAKAIEGVRDYTEKEKSDGYSGNSRIRFWTAEGSDWYESASTASEVLAAIQEAQGVVPRHVEGTLAVDMGRGQDASRLAFWRNADTSQVNGEGVTRNTILAGPITERFERSHLSVREVDIAAKIVYVKNSLSRALLNLTGEVWEVTEHIFPARFVFTCKSPSRATGYQVGFYNENDVEEWAEQAARLAYEGGNDDLLSGLKAILQACTCLHHQGDNPACPVHGEGTAWGDLHGD